MVAFVVVLLCSNLIGPGKTCIINLPFDLQFPMLGGDGFYWTTALIFGAGNIFFPISYIFGDILTEVYGFARARKVIWAGFAAQLFATIMSVIVINLPLNPDEPFNKIIQPALEVVFGNTWRIVLGSMLAFWIGDFVNSYVLAKMKVWTKGRFLWTRTIGSTICGQAVDSMVFYPIAFAGVLETKTLLALVVFNWGFKVGVEVVMTPFTYLVCNWLKKQENVDHFDSNTNFTPFSLKD